MREPYASLREVQPFRIKSFLNQDNIDGLCGILKQHPSAKHAIEIGTYYGMSARIMAEVAKVRGGSLVCVDTWTPCDQFQGGDDSYYFDGDIYEQFLSNVIHWKLDDVITPMRMTSVEAAAIYDGPQADLIYIDAYHTYDALKADMLAWWPHLAPGGVMCGDDFVWKDIPRAIGDACHELGAKPTPTKATFWKLEPKARETCLKG